MNHNHKLYCKNTTLAFRPQGRAVGVPAAYLQEAKEGGRWRVLAGARFSEHCAHCGSTNGYVVHRVDHQGKQCHNANCRDGAAPYQTAWFSLPDTLHSSVEMLHDIVFFTKKPAKKCSLDLAENLLNKVAQKTYIPRAASYCKPY